MSKGILTLSTSEVLRIRKTMADMKIGSKEFGSERALYPERLESAVARQVAGYRGYLKYKKIESVAATLFFGLACSHSFDNGNKRTALVSTLVLLEKNHSSLAEATEEDLYALATDVADHKQCERFSRHSNSDDVVADVARWFRSRIRDHKAGFRPMKAGAFLTSLKNLGCDVGPPISSFVRVSPPAASTGRVAKIYYGGDGKELGADYIRDIRRRLGLGLADGVDEATFFDLEPAVDRFVHEYRGVLERLADA